MDGQKSYIGQSVFEWSLMEMSLISGCARICYHRNRANWRLMDLRNRPSARRLLLLSLCLCCSTIASCPRGDWLTFAPNILCVHSIRPYKGHTSYTKNSARQSRNIHKTQRLSLPTFRIVIMILVKYVV
jgi:hypothetical protein